MDGSTRLAPLRVASEISGLTLVGSTLLSPPCSSICTDMTSCIRAGSATGVDSAGDAGSDTIARSAVSVGSEIDFDSGDDTASGIGAGSGIGTGSGMDGSGGPFPLPAICKSAEEALGETRVALFFDPVREATPKVVVGSWPGAMVARRDFGEGGPDAMFVGDCTRDTPAPPREERL
ncbi:hypothetical protein DFJ77DRAFT_10816 [Powellomyces hirtus]|nr:hypothetical protein DFJ77DRAFT_10816 [Powellomyces hirtus]